MPGGVPGARSTARPAARSRRRPRPSTARFSGGADSTALLVSPRAGCSTSRRSTSTTAAADSAAEAEQRRAAARRARRRRSASSASTSPTGPTSRRGPATPAALPAGALTGHTADDRAETVLINLLRGAGLDGLAAMGPGPTRPLLACAAPRPRRCAPHLGLDPVDDPSNDDRRFVRNRVSATSCCRCSTTSPAATSSPARAHRRPAGRRRLALARASAAEDRPDRRPPLAAAAPALARRAPCALARRRRLPARRGDRRPGARRSPPASRACELGGGRRVERHRQRLRIVDAGSRSPAVDGMTSGDEIRHGRAADR